MAGSTFGNYIKITTWGESHGKALGVVIDGFPAGLKLSEQDIQLYLDRRKPGQSKFTTARAEGDEVVILSGVFNGVTTGTPISLMVENKDQHSKDYGNIATTFRPGHADYGFIEKYGIRDYRGGGRSSGRETIGRVAAGAVCAKLLQELGVTVCAYTKSIGDIKIYDFDLSERDNNPLCMPDANAAKKAEEKVVAETIEAKKTTREAAAKAKKTVKKADKTVKALAKKAKAAKLEIVIQSPMGGNITSEEIAAKLPKDAETVFVRVDQNKLWWIKGEETGSVDIW